MLQDDIDSSQMFSIEDITIRIINYLKL